MAQKTNDGKPTGRVDDAGRLAGLSSPDDVVRHPQLSRAEKMAILKRWADEERAADREWREGVLPGDRSDRGLDGELRRAMQAVEEEPSAPDEAGEEPPVERTPVQARAGGRPWSMIIVLVVSILLVIVAFAAVTLLTPVPDVR